MSEGSLEFDYSGLNYDDIFGDVVSLLVMASSLYVRSEVF